MIQTPQEVDDADFGRLKAERDGWRGEYRFNECSISVSLGTPDITADHAVRTLGRSAFAALSQLDEAARRFLSTHAPELVVEALDEIAVFYPHTDWVKEAGPNGETRNRHFDAKRPVLSLIYTLVDDRNVVDVIFSDGEPVEADYH